MIILFLYILIYVKMALKGITIQPFRGGEPHGYLAKEAARSEKWFVDPYCFLRFRQLDWLEIRFRSGQWGWFLLCWLWSRCSEAKKQVPPPWWGFPIWGIIPLQCHLTSSTGNHQLWLVVLSFYNHRPGTWLSKNVAYSIRLDCRYAVDSSTFPWSNLQNVVLLYWLINHPYRYNISNFRYCQYYFLDFILN